MGWFPSTPGNHPKNFVTEFCDYVFRERPLTFVVESVDSVDAGAFVVAAEKEEVFGVLDLVGEQQTDRFQRLFTAVDVIALKSRTVSLLRQIIFPLLKPNLHYRLFNDSLLPENTLLTKEPYSSND